jgi:hypothetical protein
MLSSKWLFTAGFTLFTHESKHYALTHQGIARDEEEFTVERCENLDPHDKELN